jgi:hypothetical protein
VGDYANDHKRPGAGWRPTAGWRPAVHSMTRRRARPGFSDLLFHPGGKAAQGNIWWIQAHVEDVDPADMAQRPHDPAAGEALRYVETSLDAAMRETKTWHPHADSRITRHQQ